MIKSKNAGTRKCAECGDRFKKVNDFWKYCMQKDPCVSAHLKDALKSKEKSDLKKQKKADIEKKQSDKVLVAKVYHTEYKKNLQDEINKLARMIDLSFGYRCIDCDRAFGENDVNGSHFHNVGGNENIRYNLHNIHAAKVQCNKFQGGRKLEYRQGLVERYSESYAEMVDKEIPLKYPYLGLKEVEIVEKLKIVRKLIRTFDTFVFSDAIDARNKLNLIIGIYT